MIMLQTQAPEINIRKVVVFIRMNKTFWVFFWSQGCFGIECAQRFNLRLNQSLVAMETLDCRIFTLLLLNQEPLSKIMYAKKA